MVLKLQMKSLKKAKHLFYVFQNITREECEDIENEYSECESCHSKEKQIAYFMHKPKGYIKT